MPKMAATRQSPVGKTAGCLTFEAKECERFFLKRRITADFPSSTCLIIFVRGGLESFGGWGKTGQWGSCREV